MSTTPVPLTFAELLREPPLTQLNVLLLDCQATAAAPAGHLLEVGWNQSRADGSGARTCLVTLPVGERIPPAVSRITGIRDSMLHDAVDPQTAWLRVTAEAATLAQQPAPTVIHFARFEEPFLSAAFHGAPPFEIVCTHEIATRLVPDLPRRSLRALAGYFGMTVSTLRRSRDHVEATAFVWRELIGQLETRGITTWSALRRWLATSLAPPKRSRRVWPMPREVRLSLPDRPGVYRMLRTNGDVLYVGKASSLRDRVNSHFRHQHGVHERALEMLSQARDLSFELAPTALEAALLEADEIKRHQPPYNVALRLEDRAIWFASSDLRQHDASASPRCPTGPFPSRELLEQFAALTGASRAALGRGRWAPDESVFRAGYARFSETHVESTSEGPPTASSLLAIGTRLWREGRRDRDDAQESSVSGAERRRPTWAAETVRSALEWLVLRAALARRRANWLTWLADASVGWVEPDTSTARWLEIRNGDLIAVGPLEDLARLPAPCRGDRPRGERRAAFTLARFDRLRVLTTELKRLVSTDTPVAVRFGQAPPLTKRTLAAALWWL